MYLMLWQTRYTTGCITADFLSIKYYWKISGLLIFIFQKEMFSKNELLTEKNTRKNTRSCWRCNFQFKLRSFLHNWESLGFYMLCTGSSDTSPVTSTPMSFPSLCCLQGSRGQALGYSGLTQLLGKYV